ncbi:MAG TPA: flagellar biosynthesis anti-sigma factor FlgM [Rhizobacter sp.]|jgi:negative regulator of flagellin synthesis FlgM|nr:flagellar biosynthesis anti-sigma factor FlgM [Rhizobacter sp.]
MKVTPLPFQPALSSPAVETARESAAPAAPAAPAVAPEASSGDSAVLRSAQAGLAKMEEIDTARVAEICAALERGEISFDPAKLAGLIERHHGGRG